MKHKNEQFTKKKYLASFIFFMLPETLQNKLKDFLTSEELRKLTKSKIKKENLPYLQDTILPLFISRIEKPLLKSNAAEYFFSFCFFMGLISLLTVERLSLAAAELLTTVNFLVYAVLGYILLKRKNAVYWKMRFWSVSFEFSLFAFSVFSFALIVFLVGWLSVDSYPVRVNFFLAVQAVAAGPFVEEVFFRDYVYSLFQSKKTSDFIYDEMPAVFISSAAFAAAHLGSSEWVLEASAYLPAGLLLGFLRWMSKSLLYPFAVHAAANAVLLWI